MFSCFYFAFCLCGHGNDGDAGYCFYAISASVDRASRHLKSIWMESWRWAASHSYSHTFQTNILFSFEQCRFSHYTSSSLPPDIPPTQYTHTHTAHTIRPYHAMPKFYWDASSENRRKEKNRQNMCGMWPGGGRGCAEGRPRAARRTALALKMLANLQKVRLMTWSWKAVSACTGVLGKFSFSHSPIVIVVHTSYTNRNAHTHIYAHTRRAPHAHAIHGVACARRYAND